MQIPGSIKPSRRADLSRQLQEAEWPSSLAIVCLKTAATLRSPIQCHALGLAHCALRAIFNCSGLPQDPLGLVAMHAGHGLKRSGSLLRELIACLIWLQTAQLPLSDGPLAITCAWTCWRFALDIFDTRSVGYNLRLLPVLGHVAHVLQPVGQS